MPFVTSEIYSKLICFGTEDLMISSWPTIREEFAFDKEENIIEKLKKLIVEIRNIRTKMNVHPTKKSKLLIVSNSIENEIKEVYEIDLVVGPYSCVHEGQLNFYFDFLKEVYLKGYKLKDRIIRHAKVMVSVPKA